MTARLHPPEEDQLNQILNEVIRPVLAGTYPEPTVVMFRLKRDRRTDEFYCYLTPHTILARIQGEIHWLRDELADKEFLLLSLGRSVRAYFLSKGGLWYR